MKYATSRLSLPIIFATSGSFQSLLYCQLKCVAETREMGAIKHPNCRLDVCTIVGSGSYALLGKLQSDSTPFNSSTILSAVWLSGILTR